MISIKTNVKITATFGSKAWTQMLTIESQCDHKRKHKFIISHYVIISVNTNAVIEPLWTKS